MVTVNQCVYTVVFNSFLSVLYVHKNTCIVEYRNLSVLYISNRV